MQDNYERLGTQHPIKPAVMGFPADKVTCRMQTFECSLLRPLAYTCLFSRLLYRANHVYSIIPAAAGIVNSSGAGSWKIWRALCGRAVLLRCGQCVCVHRWEKNSHKNAARDSRGGRHRAALYWMRQRPCAIRRSFSGCRRRRLPAPEAAATAAGCPEWRKPPAAAVR